MTLARRVTRKLGLHRSGSSFPFISGDTYRALCDFTYDGDNYQLSQQLDEFSKSSSKKLFVPLPLATQFLKWAESDQRDFSAYQLLLHNGDTLPQQDDLELLSSRFNSVKCVNWMGKARNIEAIPIGLENRSLHVNGVPKDFIKLIKGGIPELQARKNQLLVSFNISTNTGERSNALDAASGCTDVPMRQFQGSLRQYHRELISSKYVLSPPGNGVDCHRTWEAMYLGAIPIVKKKYWPFNHLDLPVIVLEDWADLNKLSLAEEKSQTNVESLKELFLEN
jgi:hypothetical protein